MNMQCTYIRYTPINRSVLWCIHCIHCGLKVSIRRIISRSYSPYLKIKLNAIFRSVRWRANNLIVSRELEIGEFVFVCDTSMSGISCDQSCACTVHMGSISATLSIQRWVFGLFCGNSVLCSTIHITLHINKRKRKIFLMLLNWQ